MSKLFLRQPQQTMATQDDVTPQLASATNTLHIRWLTKQVEDCHEELDSLLGKAARSPQDIAVILSVCIACRKMTSTGS
jgi:hypothetical protein